MRQSLNDALSMLNVVMTTMSRMERRTKPVDLPINAAPAINDEHSNNPWKLKQPKNNHMQLKNAKKISNI